MFVWAIDCAGTPDNPWCQIGVRPKGTNIGGVENHLYYQLQTSGWRPNGPAAPGYIPNANAYWLGVQARSAKDGDSCTFLRLSNQVKNAMEVSVLRLDSLHNT